MPDLICADVREGLKEIADESVQVCITSPPFYGLRAYGTEPQIFGGREDCEHEWSEAPPRRSRKATDVVNMASKQATSVGTMHDLKPTDICSKCSAWRGELGLEPTPELYIEHLVSIFALLRPKLHKTGLLVVNMGDSYAGSWGATSHDLDGKAKRTGTNKRPPQSFVSSKRIPRGSGRWGGGNMPATGYLKPKDLMEMPSRLVLALQADGWWLRSRIPWIKRNSMPESVTDRPSSAVEYFFMLSKSKDCYWDQEAIRIKAKPETWGLDKNGQYQGKNLADYKGAGVQVPGDIKSRIAKSNIAESGRNRRNSDWFMESWQGLYCEDGEPLALIVNPQPHNHKKFGAHFATFPEKAIEPFVMAGTSEKGQCSKCKSPYERIIKSKDYHFPEKDKDDIQIQNNVRIGRYKSGADFAKFKADNPTQFLGWRPTCECNAAVEPQLVCDIFMGSGTVGLVALRAGRRMVGIELNPAYVEIGRKRLAPYRQQEGLKI
jgi:DNA modification methylase